jgi:hypothetical protein
MEDLKVTKIPRLQLQLRKHKYTADGEWCQEFTAAQASAAGESAARKAIESSRDYPAKFVDFDSIETLRSYVVTEGIANMDVSTLLGDVFCDSFDAEIERERWRNEK